MRLTSPSSMPTSTYIVLSTGVSSRYLAQPREYPVECAFYYAMDRHFQEVASMRPGVYTGPGIRILKRRPDLPIPDASEIPRSVWEPHKGNTALAEHLSALGTVYVRDGRQDLGFDLLQIAVDMAPESGVVWGNLGSMNLREGRLENALTALRRARDLAPEDADMWFNLATLMSRMGESSQAGEAFQQAINLRPEMEEAYIGLARALIEGDSLRPGPGSAPGVPEAVPPIPAARGPRRPPWRTSATWDRAGPDGLRGRSTGTRTLF